MPLQNLGVVVTKLARSSWPLHSVICMLVVIPPQIYMGDPRPCMLPHDVISHGTSAMGLKLGVFGFFADHAKTAVDTGDIPTWRTMVILIMRKTWRPQFEPHAGIKNGTGSVYLRIPLKCCTYHFMSIYRLLLEIIYFVLDVRIWNSTPSHYPIVGLRDIPLPAWILAFVWPLVCLTVCEIIKIFEIR